MRSWPDFIAGVDRHSHADAPEARRALVDLILELADDFIAPTQDALTRAELGQPPGGWVYDLEDWCRAADWRDSPSLLLEDLFSSAAEFSVEEIAEALHERNIKLLKPGTEPWVHRVWVGAQASQELGRHLQHLEVPTSVRESAAAREDFLRLRVLLDRKIPRGPLSCLVAALFELSPELGCRELDRPHPDFVRALLELAAGEARG